MLRLTCPYCGIRADETELAAGGAAHIERRGPEADDETFAAYLFERENPAGPIAERWRHRYGCGRWFIAVRDTRTNAVLRTYRAQADGPPDDVRAAMEADG